MAADPTARFSSRVHAYVRFRPRYPVALLADLEAHCGLTAESAVADVGSGTGMLSELFLNHGNDVFAVEPNREMREAAEALLGDWPRFLSVVGRAEATTLADKSVSMVAAGQAFHWFDRLQARAEFARILEPGGSVALVWNVRDTRSTPFLAAYERLLEEFSVDYAEVRHERIDHAVLSAFFGRGGFRTAVFPNRQVFDYGSLEGRLLSSSYAPEAGDPRHAPMLEELARIFTRFQEGGRVAFEYATTLHSGRL